MAEVRVDDRNRIPVPTRFMDVLRGLDEYSADPKGIEVVVGLDRTGKLGVFPKSVHEELLERLDEQDPDDPRWDEIRETIFGSSDECKLDVQNRVKISGPLCKLLGLSGEVIVRGVGKYLQVLSMDDWMEGAKTAPEKYRALYAERQKFQG